MKRQEFDEMRVEWLRMFPVYVTRFCNSHGNVLLLKCWTNISWFNLIISGNFMILSSENSVT